MRKKLQDYLPPILLKTYEFPLLCETEQPEIDRLHDAADAVLDAQFLSTAGEYAIQRYEKIFGVVPQDTDTLDYIYLFIGKNGSSVAGRAAKAPAAKTE